MQKDKTASLAVYAAACGFGYGHLQSRRKAIQPLSVIFRKGIGLLSKKLNHHSCHAVDIDFQVKPKTVMARFEQQVVRVGLKKCLIGSQHVANRTALVSHQPKNSELMRAHKQFLVVV